MEISKKQFEKIKNLMPLERKPAKISNQQFLNTLLYIVENGCKWHTLYMKFNRWSKNGPIQRIFEELQSQNIIDVQRKILCLDSTSVKGHPDAATLETRAVSKVSSKNWRFDDIFSRAKLHFVLAESGRDMRVEALYQKGANNENTRSLRV